MYNDLALGIVRACEPQSPGALTLKCTWKSRVGSHVCVPDLEDTWVFWHESFSPGSNPWSVTQAMISFPPHRQTPGFITFCYHLQPCQKMSLPKHWDFGRLKPSGLEVTEVKGRMRLQVNSEHGGTWPGRLGSMPSEKPVLCWKRWFFHHQKPSAQRHSSVPSSRCRAFWYNGNVLLWRWRQMGLTLPLTMCVISHSFTSLHFSILICEIVMITVSISWVVVRLKWNNNIVFSSVPCEASTYRWNIFTKGPNLSRLGLKALPRGKITLLT